ncbi:UDP-N-acetylglucosamine transferase subunit ALG13 [Anaerobranca californiensis DSM 14826]|jgi:UDP-N-acetylglucosamine transferase subunit ALG13|uniref:UDP-N-acetylglucosamine transferase subunit ALG13 n=1 Tax=Anaerobranca californiensis DSM 14826 TaxID=1120989 RepID=A0A1M6NB59_9FIRM|nr:PssE/Cps14G family polysaccharide biosynthesis glycosyltransferase [Anaerobranca californiensis]SHJ92904.1 UDP-N-acetylglucosamine transferase subunit ALG13 [Anaerobranca californiensis DSM 14826]
MIFVVLGTQDIPFTRLLKKLDRLITDGKIKEQVIVQSGFTKYSKNNMKVFDFLSPEEMDSYYDKAKFIISHGGTGSLMKGIKKRKKIIAVPRLAKYNEHKDDHQLEIVRLFAEKKYLLAIENIDELDKALEDIETFEPEIYISKKDVIIKTIEQFIDAL